VHGFEQVSRLRTLYLRAEVQLLHCSEQKRLFATKEYFSHGIGLVLEHAAVCHELHPEESSNGIDNGAQTELNPSSSRFMLDMP